MGREVRRVPPHWEHPKTTNYGDERYQPMYDNTFDEAAKDWKDGYAAWERGERDSWCEGDSRSQEYWEWEGSPPDREYYRPYSDDEATWFQVYETVSEGTPVTPPFETREELINYLATFGDFWDQRRGHGPWKRANAESFVNEGYAPSLVVVTGGEASGVYAPRDGQP